MSDYYTEQLVKRKAPASAMLIKILLILVTVLSVVAVMMIPFGIIITALLICLDVYLFHNMDLEYEYLYVNGNLDIDKIMAKTRRKRIFSMELSEMEVIAPAGAPELRPYQGIKAKNFGSGNPNAKVYEMIIAQKGDKQKIAFEPNETILEGMRMMAPRKVVR